MEKYYEKLDDILCICKAVQPQVNSEQNQYLNIIREKALTLLAALNEHLSSEQRNQKVEGIITHEIDSYHNLIISTLQDVG